MEYQACNNVPLIGLCDNLWQKGACDDCVLQSALAQGIKRGCGRQKHSYVKVPLLCFRFGRNRSEKFFLFYSEVVYGQQIRDLMVLERWENANLSIGLHPLLARPNDLCSDQ